MRPLHERPHIWHLWNDPQPHDELEAVLEREAIERYVARLRSGDLTDRPAQAETFVPDQPSPEEDSHWDMDLINANWAALFGAAPTAANDPPPSPPPCSTAPTARPVASQPSASARSASSTRRSTMTIDRYTYRAANAIPNADPDLTTMTVAQVMQARGVGKRRAYTLMRQATAAKMDVPVPTNQRELLLSLLHKHGDYIRNSSHLSDAVHEAGSKLPPHDVTKTLWSLQKTQHVSFRERANGTLYAIKLTPEGKKAASSLSSLIESPDTENIVVDTPGFMAQAVFDAALDEADQTEGAHTTRPPEIVTEVGPDADPYEKLAEHVAKVTENARKFQEEINALGAGVPGSTILAPSVPLKPWDDSMGGWPAFRDVRDRARRAIKLREAAKLLEEVGEDEMALDLIGKTEFTSLEEEVIELLKRYAEIE